MAVYDAIFWEKESSEGLFRILQSYNFRVLRIKPPLRQNLMEFFQYHSTGVIFTDKPGELADFGSIAKSVFVVAILPDDPGDVLADVVLKRSLLNGQVSLPLVNRIVQLVTKARAIAQIQLDLEEDELDLEIELTGREKDLYTLLKSYPQGLSMRQITQFLGWKDTMVRVYISKLKQKGIPVRFDGKKYVMKEEVLI